MTSIDLRGGGAALVLVGLLWVGFGGLASHFGVSLPWYGVVGAALLTAGVVVSGLAPEGEEEGQALTAEDLE